MKTSMKTSLKSLFVIFIAAIMVNCTRSHVSQNLDNAIISCSCLPEFCECKDDSLMMDQAPADWTTDSLPSQEGYITVHDGHLYYREFGHGLPIIVVHGGPGLDQGYLQPQLLELASDYRLIFYDQRGSGKSFDTKIDEEHINIDQFVNDLDVLRKSLGLDKFVVMGHSWGGFLAMEYAIAHQDHLMGLILLTPAPADDQGQKAFLEEFEVRAPPIRDEIMPFFAFEDFKKLNGDQVAELYRRLFSVYVYDPNTVKDLHLHFSTESAQSGYHVLEEMTKTSWLKPGTNLFPNSKH